MRSIRGISAFVLIGVYVFSGVDQARAQTQSAETCRQPFDPSTGSTLQSIEDILAGFLSLCAYRRSSRQSLETQMRKFIVFYVLGSDNETYTQTAESDVPAAIQLDLPTYILIHGFDVSANPNDSSWMTTTGQQLRQNNPCNVIMLDYGSISNCSYIYLATVGISDMGLYLSGCISRWGLQPALVEIIGHSLGAHIGGVAGIDLNGQLARVTGLDPAGPLISAAIGNSLTTDSAIFVQVLHTSSIGVQQNIGHADFYANRYALAQPNCELDDISCSHSRSTEIYYASCFAEYPFVGTSCAECHPSCGTAQFGYNTTETHGCFQFTTSGCFGYSLN